MGQRFGVFTGFIQIWDIHGIYTDLVNLEFR